MKLAIFIVLCTVFAVGVARAQTGAEIRSCWADAFRLCKHAFPHGMGAIKECLVINNGKVSHPCRKTLKHYGA